MVVNVVAKRRGDMTHQEALRAYREKDFQKAYNYWIEQAEQKDNSQAMVNLGLMHLKGEGVAKDMGKAHDWFIKSDSLGNESGSYNLALLYQSGIGVQKDLKRAVSYFKKATNAGHDGAAFRLGLLLLQDRTDKENLKVGFDAMLQAARASHPMALSQVGGVDRKPNKEAELNHEFRDSSHQKQLEIINDALERYIRPMLLKDGGDIDLVSYTSTPEIEIKLAYLGNCAGCSLGATSTYELIYNTLSGVIDANISLFVI